MKEQPPSPAELRSIVAENFAQHRTAGGGVSLRPRVIVGVDPDSKSTAFCVADLASDRHTYIIREVEGGGTPKQAARWQSTHGIAELLRAWAAGLEPDELIVAVEKQGLKSEFAHSCEPLFRWRYTCAALCELRGVRCIEVEPLSWMRAVVPQAFKRGKPSGTAKAEYQAFARALVGPKLAKNEDRCAAVGITAWLAAGLGCHLRVRSEVVK